MMEIEHAHADCTGAWHLQAGELICDGCDHRYPATPERRMAAVDENALGDLLQLGTKEGTMLLSEDEP